MSFLLLGLIPVALAFGQTEARVTQLPFVQLGDRIANGADSFAITWHTTNAVATYRLSFTQGKETKQARVSYRNVNIETAEPHRVYTAILTGYRPGEKLSYTLSHDGNVVYEGEVAAPKTEKQAYTFAVFGDCGRNTPQQAKISYQTYLKRPDFLVLTGDIVYNSGRISEYQKNFFPFYTGKTASPETGSPLISSTLTVGVPGNHDILDRELARNPDLLAYYYYWTQPLNGPLTTVGGKSTPTLSGPFERQNAILKAAGGRYPRMSNFSFEYGNSHWTVLDANRYVDWSDPELRNWLKEDLAKAAKKTWRFVTFHQPGFHSSATHQQEKQMRQVADLFEAGKVDIVFNGHVHNYQRTFPMQTGDKAGKSTVELAKDDWPVDKKYDGKKITRAKGVIYIVDGAGGAPLYNNDLNNKPELWKPYQANYIADYGFSFVKINGRKLSLVQIDMDGKEVDAITITK